MDTKDAIWYSNAFRHCQKPDCVVCEAERYLQRAAEELEALKLMIATEQGPCESCRLYAKCGGVTKFYTLEAWCQDFNTHKQDWINAWYESTEVVPKTDPEAEKAYYADIRRAEAEDEYHPEGV